MAGNAKEANRLERELQNEECKLTIANWLDVNDWAPATCVLQGQGPLHSEMPVWAFLEEALK